MSPKKKNRGKDFENEIRKSLEECKVLWLRLKDDTSRKKGVSNPCDFIAYDYPLMFMLECKSCYGNTLPFSNIRPNQWHSLYEASQLEGVIAGYVIWFIDHDLTIFVEARDLMVYRIVGRKSINIKDVLSNKLPHVVVYGEKKQILFTYKIIRLFDYIKNYKREYIE